MKIEKSKGVTPTEEWLSNLCERTFLKLWSWPNPCKQDGKELCDLIAVFDDHVFVFFDRESNSLQDAGKNINVTWSRWKKQVIDKQINTAKGAERYIKNCQPIYLRGGWGNLNKGDKWYFCSQSASLPLTRSHHDKTNTPEP